MNISTETYDLKTRSMFPDNCFITVVVTVYDRVNLVIDALESLQKQTLHKDLFEVILVTNIPLNLPNFSNLNLYVIRSDAKKGTAKYLQGIELSKGEVICFLEDDDVFVPNKLELVYSIFKNNPKLAFYRNKAIKTRNIKEVLDKKESANDINSKVRYYELSELSPRIFWRMRRERASFNTSTMCVRKKFYETENVKSLMIRPDIAGDELIFAIPFTLNGPIQVATDSRKLTIYRIHESFTYSKYDFITDGSPISDKYVFFTFMKRHYQNMVLLFGHVDFIKRHSNLEIAAYSLKVSLIERKYIDHKILPKTLVLSILERNPSLIIYLFIYATRLILPTRLNIKLERTVLKILEIFAKSTHSW